MDEQVPSNQKSGSDGAHLSPRQTAPVASGSLPNILADPPSSKDVDHLINYFPPYQGYKQGSEVVEQGAATICLLLSEIERLQTALRGISSCSTCEACRGAATLALGGTERTYPFKAIDCPHTEHTFQCNGCGLDVRNARLAPEPGVSVDRAYELGWRVAAEWAGRDDLICDIGSPVYEQDRAKAFGTAQPPGDDHG